MSERSALVRIAWWEMQGVGWRDGRVGLLTSPLLAVRFCRAPAQASKVASFLLLPMRFR